MPAVTKETLLRYCQSLYDALERDAKPTGEYELLWEGAIIKLFTTLRISNAHYARIMQTLYETGSIEQVRRGARNSPTQIALYERPTAEALERIVGAESDLTRATPHDKLSQRVASLERRLEGIDIAEVVANLHQRLQALEVKQGKKGAHK